MKKYIAFIVTFIFMGLFYSSADDMFQVENKSALEGTYIEKIDDRLALSKAMYVMKNIQDENARALEEVKVNELKASLTLPPQSLDKIKWMKSYFTKDGFGVLAVFFSLLGLIISLAFYFKLQGKELEEYTPI